MPASLLIDAPVDKKFLVVGEFLVKHSYHLVNDDPNGNKILDEMFRSARKHFPKLTPKNKKTIMDAYIMGLKYTLNLTDDEYKEKLAYCRKAYRNLKLYGYSNWYDWCENKWGTKWNAIDSTPLNELFPEYDEDKDCWSICIRFQTAWNAPAYILKSIAEHFPTLSGINEFADEEYGADAGTIYFSKDKFSVDYLEDFSYEAFSHSLTVWKAEELFDALKQDETGSYYIDYSGDM